jgi:hypothetical protein
LAALPFSDISTAKSFEIQHDANEELFGLSDLDHPSKQGHNRTIQTSNARSLPSSRTRRELLQQMSKDNPLWGAYGQAFTNRIRTMGIRDRPIAPRSPWQNPYVEV